jgi:putative transposase
LKVEKNTWCEGKTVGGSTVGYNRSKHAVYLINYHFVFVPKYRWKLLRGAIRERLLVLIDDYAERYSVTVLAIEVMPDHVHLFLGTRPDVAPSQIALYLKGWTSRVLRQEFPWLQKYKAFWTPSYFVCSSGNVSSATIKKYIEECQNI